MRNAYSRAPGVVGNYSCFLGFVKTSHYMISIQKLFLQIDMRLAQSIKHSKNDKQNASHPFWMEAECLVMRRSWMVHISAHLAHGFGLHTSLAWPYIPSDLAITEPRRFRVGRGEGKNSPLLQSHLSRPGTTTCFVHHTRKTQV